MRNKKMGYHTYYNLTTVETGESDADIVQRLTSQEAHYPQIAQALAEVSDCLSEKDGLEMQENGISLKWYGYHQEMLALSLKLPEMTFQLSGYGDDDGDIWQAFYHNGAWYEDSFSGLPAFDPERMQETARGCAVV